MFTVNDFNSVQDGIQMDFIVDNYHMIKEKKNLFFILIKSHKKTN